MSKAKKCGTFMRRNLLTVLTIVGVIGGTVCGLVLKQVSNEWTKREIMYLQYPGELFLRMLKCLIVPLLVSSITSAIGALDLGMSKRIAFRAIIYYFTTTICAVILGIILVTTIRPGYIADNEADTTGKSMTRPVLTTDTLLDLIRNMFPPNIVQATVFQYQTILTPPENMTKDGFYLQTDSQSGVAVERKKIPLTEYKIGHNFTQITNVLGLVMFSIILGITIGKLKEKGKPLQDLFVALSDATMTITQWVIWISPIGVFFLVAAKLLELGSFAKVVDQLGWYFMTVMLGLFLHGFGTIALIFFMVTKKLPFRYIIQMSQVLATAFGTGSSSATMPITINCLDQMGIDPRVTRFVIPVGATINMDGTALYEAVAALFIAQFRRIDLTFGHIIAVSVTATAASIGAAGIPQAGLVTMVMVLDTVGLPADDVIIIIAVDWLLDRFRTTINVMCDALGTILVNHLTRNDFKNEIVDPHELQELGAVGK